MSITLGELRAYAAETAGADANSKAGDRKLHEWINDALEEVWIGHDWDWSIDHVRVLLVPEETGTTLSVTQGSRRVTLSAAGADVFAQKFADERWYLLIDAESRMVFELEQIEDAKTAWLKEGQDWPNATAADLSYTFVRSVYPVPGGATKIYRVEDLAAYGEVVYRLPARFDYLQSVSPTHRGNRPEFYTLRKDRLEVWPGPGANYVSLGVTYKRPAPSFSDSDPDTAEIDWPRGKLSLLRKGILVQAGVALGENAPVPYGLALVHYSQLLKRHKSEDSDRTVLGGPMDLEGLSRSAADFSRLGGITDDFA